MTDHYLGDGPTERDRARATAVIEQLVVRELQEIDDIGTGVSVADIEQDVDQFLDEIELAEAFGGPLPAIQLDDEQLVPASFQALDLELFPYRSLRRWRDFGSYYDPYDYYNAMLRAATDRGMETIPTDEARSTFTQRAAEFLSTRIAAASNLAWASSLLRLPRRRSDSAKISAPGATVAVTTNTAGLRVHWSGAYYVSGRYFGHPTTPVGGVLQSGDYVFGVDGGVYGGPVQWDATILTLPGKPSIHLNY